MNEHYFSKKPKAKHKIREIKAFLKGKEYKFLTDSSVFSGKRIDLGTKILIESMEIKPKDIVLDFGCGYGPIGIVAASFGKEVYLIDLNERAVNLAKKNIKLNKIKNAKAMQGNLFEPVKNKKFNVILTNPPMRAGREIIFKIIEESKKHLKPEGRFYLVAKTRQGAKIIKEKMNEIFGNCEEIEKKSGYRVLMSKLVS